MKTEILRKDISLAVDAINNGEIVAFPTETVYGLGGDAFCISAINKIFEVKGRAKNNPLNILCASVEQAKSLTSNWNQTAEILARDFWPGALTLILPKSEKVSEEITAGNETVGIRIPNQKQALELIKRSNTPIVAPSANLSGRPSPTQATHVFSDLNGKIPFIIDGGNSKIGLESTIFDCQNQIILRLGAVTKSQIEKSLGHIVGVETKKPSQKHYHPSGYNLIIMQGSVDYLLKLYKNYTTQGKRVKILLSGDEEIDNIDVVELGKTNQEKSANLYNLLIELENEADLVLCFIDEKALDQALLDRLLKAAEYIIKKESEENV